MTDAADQGGAFFGRRKGHKLRLGQAGLVSDLLPRLRIDPQALADPASLFATSVEEVRLEIGFGGGEHLLSRARSAPTTGFIGCEPFVNGMAKMLAAIAAEDLGNVRLWDGDAEEVLAGLPDASVSTVYLLYPDPWPKRRHNKRRFVSDARLAQIARVLRPGGHFLFASDIDHYVGWTLARILRSPDLTWTAARPGDWRTPFPGWPGTRYEAKAIREGRVASYITARKAG
ncbi:tRNA (guanosine(46)-N(7))-methyltransferase TrmB [uncultured Alsobacter sp.]|uniref:tRNA (guanine(46)-N(7))-methyltransferase TrmB n=1 Tax=uncultured Alsobacter sp. TaxID=1748258 RepID=UPI0025E0D8B3|nr:tRNA (guanine(46)-N(7))-methyltransferase TrmB [uncultured Alsobacter sp.]